VFDHDHRIPPVCESVENIEEPLNICKMEACGGLVENVNGSSGLALAQLPRQLDPLGFTPGKGRRRLAQAKISQPDVTERL